MADVAEEIGGKIRVVHKPQITGNKRKRKTDFIGATSSGEYMYVARLPPLKQLWVYYISFRKI